MTFATRRQLERCTLTRANVAELLGVSTSTVRRLEGSTLHPVQSRSGVWWFDAEQVERLRASETHRTRAYGGRGKDPGRTAARVFEMFDAGCNLRQVVVRTKLEPHAVRELFREYNTPLGKK
jgi:hypothetical protein